jgi:putative ABC transport system substrate-binding protein
MRIPLQRRDVLALICGTAAARVSGETLAQTPEKQRRIGVLINIAEEDPEAKARVEAFRRGLQERGWIEGRNAGLEIRYGAGDAERIGRQAVELVGLAPDVILSAGSVTVPPLLRATRGIPIVFVHVPDPVGAGFVDSMAHPGGNATGLINYEYGISAKWLELLKEVAPSVIRAGILRDPAITAGIGLFGSMQGAAPSLGIEAVPLNVRDAAEIERALAAFARSPNAGLVVTGSALSVVHRDLIIALAAKHKLPAVYYDRLFVAAGGLAGYGPRGVDQYSQAADYVDRILKGEKPAGLPVQAPTKYELVINLSTAKALNLTIPPTLLARADEMIE